MYISAKIKKTKTNKFKSKCTVILLHVFYLVTISVKKRARLFAVLLLQADDDGQLGGEYAIEQEAEEEGEAEVKQIHEVEYLVDDVLVAECGQVAHRVGKGEREKGEIESDRDEDEANVALDHASVGFATRDEHLDESGQREHEHERERHHGRVDELQLLHGVVRLLKDTQRSGTLLRVRRVELVVDVKIVDIRVALERHARRVGQHVDEYVECNDEHGRGELKGLLAEEAASPRTSSDRDEAVERHGGQYVARDGRADALGEVSALDEEAEDVEALEIGDDERVGAEIGARRCQQHDRVEHDEHSEVDVKDGRREFAAREDEQRDRVAHKTEKDNDAVQVSEYGWHFCCCCCCCCMFAQSVLANTTTLLVALKMCSFFKLFEMRNERRMLAKNRRRKKALRV